MKIASLPLAVLAALPLSVEPARAPLEPGAAVPAVAPAAPRLARVAALHADDVAQMRRLAELAARSDLSRAERAVLDARFADRVRAIDARAHGALRAREASAVRASRAGEAAAAVPDLSAGGLGLADRSLASPEHAERAQAALERAAGELARFAPRTGG